MGGEEINKAVILSVAIDAFYLANNLPVLF